MELEKGKMIDDCSMCGSKKPYEEENNICDKCIAEQVEALGGSKFVFRATDVTKYKFQEYQDARKAAQGKYDGRSKERRAEERLEESVGEYIKNAAKNQAVIWLKGNGIELPSCVSIEVFSYRIGYRTESVDEIKPGIHLSGYTRNASKDLDKVSVEELVNWIKEQVDEKQKNTDIESARQKRAQEFLEEVKEDITSKDRSWCQEKGEKWKGRRLEMKSVKKVENGWDKEIEMKMDIDEDKIDGRVDIRQDFKSVEDAVKFWNKMKKFIKEECPEFKKVKREESY